MLSTPFASKVGLSLSRFLLPPSNDLDESLACFSNTLALLDLRDPDLDVEVFLDKYPLEEDAEGLSAPPKDCRREGPVEMFLPSDTVNLKLPLDVLTLSSKTLKRN
ncbi:hypothetical protein V8G54_021271 [Vigna mungo]|uniref:Uncharacterized protein n=1 Tax=Vigna mungo TaxID=3915 RepID=A0AAQ3NDP9_VIGMU